VEEGGFPWGELWSAARTLGEWRTCERRHYELIFCLEGQRLAMISAHKHIQWESKDTRACSYFY